MNIAALFQEQVAIRPDAPAIVAGRRGGSKRHTFAALAADSARAASLLRRQGIEKGDRVLVLQPVSYELYVVLLAIFRLGAVAMILDPSAGRAHIEQCCAIGAPRALVASPRAHLLRILSRGLRRIPVKCVTAGFAPGAVPLRASGGLPPCDRVEPTAGGDPALLTFTSGSTGRPKAAVRSHGFLVAQYEALARALQLQAGEVDLTTLPVFLLANLAAGVTSVIPDADLRFPGRVAAAPVLRQIDRCGVTRSAGSPAFYERLVEYCEQRGRTLNGLRRIDTGGAPVFPPLLQRLQRVTAHADVVSVYGSTEAEPMAHVSLGEVTGADLESMRTGRGLLVGCPVPDVAMRILCDRFGTPIGPYDAGELERQCLPPNEIGEIVVTGEHVLKAYLHGEDDADHKFEVDGRRWHRTGDAGFFDDAGRLWLVGRCSARIEDGRGVLYPFPVECAAHFLPGVRRCAMVGDKERRILLVELTGPDEPVPAVETFSWAKVDAVRVVKEIPVDRRHNAKVDYTRVHDFLR